MHSDREKLVKHMVDRFLRWRLPEDFNPDGGISFKPVFNEHTAHPMKAEPVGTNLFDAQQAEAMVRYMLDGAPALSEPVKDEPVAWWRVGEWGDGSTKPGEAVIFCDAHEAAVAAGVPSHLAKMIVEAHNDTVTRPAGERPAVAVEALRAALEPFSDMAGELFARNWNASDVVIALDNPGDPHRVTVGDFFAARRALEQKP